MKSRWSTLSLVLAASVAFGDAGKPALSDQDRLS